MLLVVGFLIFAKVDSNNMKYQSVITYGEFPFSLEYEKNDELYVMEDTLVVDEYRGNPGSLNYYPKSMNSEDIEKHSIIEENLVLYKSDGLISSLFKDNRQIYQTVKLELKPDYFKEDNYLAVTTSDLRIVLIEGAKEDKWEIGEKRTLTEQELFDLFGIKLIAWTGSSTPVSIGCKKICVLCYDRTYSLDEIRDDVDFYADCF
jgi:hypothetical protein